MLFAKALKKTVNVAVKRAPGSPLLSVVLPTACQHETHTHKDQRSTKEKKRMKEGGEVVLSEKRKQQKENTMIIEKDM